MDPRHVYKIIGFRGVNLSCADAKLHLPLVQRRAPVQELGAQYLLVPFPGLLPVGDLDVDMVDHTGFRHVDISH